MRPKLIFFEEINFYIQLNEAFTALHVFANKLAVLQKVLLR